MSLKLNSSGGGSVTLQEPSTASNLTLTLPAVTATVLTDSSGVLNIGSGQVYKDASGNVGIGTSSPSGAAGRVLEVNGGAGQARLVLKNDTTGSTSNDGSQIALVGAQLVIQNREASDISFETNNAERARIDSSGNLLVGKTTTGNTVVGLEYITSTTNPYMILTHNGSANATGSSYHAYSTGAGAYRFYVGYGGTIFATSTSISAISDISLKENVRDLETGLNQVMALRPRRFDWKAETQLEDKNVAGFIAQEVEEVLPELVYEYQYTEGETKKALKMGDILPTLVKAIQEQQSMIEELKAKVAALEAK